MRSSPGHATGQILKASQSSSRFQQMWRNGTHSDYKVCVPNPGGNGEVEYKLHSLVLSLSCDYFRALINTTTLSDSSSNLQLGPEEHPFWELFLDFVYDAGTGIDIKSSNFCGLALIANRLQCKDLLSFCIKFIEICEIPELPTLYSHALQYSLPDLVTIPILNKICEKIGELPSGSLNSLTTHVILNIVENRDWGKNHHLSNLLNSWIVEKSRAQKLPTIFSEKNAAKILNYVIPSNSTALTLFKTSIACHNKLATDHYQKFLCENFSLVTEENSCDIPVEEFCSLVTSDEIQEGEDYCCKLIVNFCKKNSPDDKKKNILWNSIRISGLSAENYHSLLIRSDIPRKILHEWALERMRFIELDQNPKRPARDLMVKAKKFKVTDGGRSYSTSTLIFSSKTNDEISFENMVSPKIGMKATMEIIGWSNKKAHSIHHHTHDTNLESCHFEFSSPPTGCLFAVPPELISNTKKITVIFCFDPRQNSVVISIDGRQVKVIEVFQPKKESSVFVDGTHVCVSVVY